MEYMYDPSFSRDEMEWMLQEQAVSAEQGLSNNWSQTKLQREAERSDLHSPGSWEWAKRAEAAQEGSVR